MKERRVDTERLVRLEERFKSLAIDTGDIMNDVKAIRADVASMSIHLAEQKGIRSAISYASHALVGIAGVALTYLGIKH
jgi:hypothetical protein